MPKQVDHRDRRERIASALLRVVAREGLEGVSLRRVATEAGVTSGMVQHYFPSKEEMVTFAMRTARSRYEARVNEAIAGLGDDPAGRDVVEAILMSLLPADEAQEADARVALAFQSHVATRRAATALLDGDVAQLRAFLAEQIGSARPGDGTSGAIDPVDAATSLLATAEGLGIQVISTDLSLPAAVAALRAQIDVTFRAVRPVARSSTATGR